MGAGLAQGGGQFVAAPGRVVWGGELQLVLGGMATLAEGVEQVLLTHGQQA